MIITISGKSGAGKTTLAKRISKKLGYNFVSVGDLQGKVATELGITVNELMTRGKKEPWIHKEIDKKTIELGKTARDIVVEGWLAFHFIPHSKKIFLEVDPKIGAQRIFKNPRPDEPRVKSSQEMGGLIQKRLIDTEKGFKKYYNINFLNHENYDFVIDTTKLTTTETLEKVLSFIKNGS